MNDEINVVEWAHEIESKLPADKKINAAIIVAKACQMANKIGDMEAAKVKVANDLLNGKERGR